GHLSKASDFAAVCFHVVSRCRPVARVDRRSWFKRNRCPCGPANRFTAEATRAPTCFAIIPRLNLPGSPGARFRLQSPGKPSPPDWVRLKRGGHALDE